MWSAYCSTQRTRTILHPMLNLINVIAFHIRCCLMSRDIHIILEVYSSWRLFWLLWVINVWPVPWILFLPMAKNSLISTIVSIYMPHPVGRLKWDYPMLGIGPTATLVHNWPPREPDKPPAAVPPFDCGFVCLCHVLTSRCGYPSREPDQPTRFSDSIRFTLAYILYHISTSLRWWRASGRIRYSKGAHGKTNHRRRVEDTMCWWDWTASCTISLGWCFFFVASILRIFLVAKTNSCVYATRSSFTFAVWVVCCVFRYDERLKNVQISNWRWRHE